MNPIEEKEIEFLAEAENFEILVRALPLMEQVRRFLRRSFVTKLTNALQQKYPSPGWTVTCNDPDGLLLANKDEDDNTILLYKPAWKEVIKYVVEAEGEGLCGLGYGVKRWSQESSIPDEAEIRGAVTKAFGREPESDSYWWISGIDDDGEYRRMDEDAMLKQIADPSGMKNAVDYFVRQVSKLQSVTVDLIDKAVRKCH